MRISSKASLVLAMTIHLLLSVTVGAIETFNEKQLQEVHDAVTERFKSELFWKLVPEWCCPDCCFTIGPVIPEYIIDEDKLAFSEDPVKIAPYIYPNGRYIAAVMVESRGCFIKKLKISDGKFDGIGEWYCPDCADRMVEVFKRIKGKEDRIDRIVYLKARIIHKYLILYKDGTEEFIGISSKNDSTPNSVKDIRDYLRMLIESYRKVPPYKES